MRLIIRQEKVQNAIVNVVLYRRPPEKTDFFIHHSDWSIESSSLPAYKTTYLIFINLENESVYQFPKKKIDYYQFFIPTLPTSQYPLFYWVYWELNKNLAILVSLVYHEHYPLLSLMFDH